MTTARNSLQLRFLGVVVAAALPFCVLAGLLAWQLGAARAHADAQATVQGLLATVHKTSAIGVYAHDDVLLQEVLEGLQSHALVDHAEVVSSEGQRLAWRGEPAPDGAARQVEHRLVSPFDPNEELGVLRVSIASKELARITLSQAATLAALMVAQAALVALVLYNAAARFVSRPIVQLSRGLRAMQPGTAQQLPTPPGHALDEIGALTTSANALLQANQCALQRERELRAEIEAMEAQYRQIFDSTSAAIFVLDAQGQLINGNPTVMKLIQAPVSELRRLRGQDFIRHAFAQPEHVHEMIRVAAMRRQTVSADLELLQRGGQGTWVHCLISVQEDPGMAPGMVEGVMYDITDRRRAEHAVRHRADHDSLTGLKNRAAVDAALHRFVSEAVCTAVPVMVLCIDLDGFKAVNDSLGHAAGDEVLVQCAQRMTRWARRATDLVGRVGGDEFVIVLTQLLPDTAATAQHVADLLAALCEPVTLRNGEVARLGASIGMACAPRHGHCREQLLHAADEALYAVKRSGKRSLAMAVAPAHPGMATTARV
jgi:diguanylate cyclase (GGDEF)-like protein/PAS domain S-box-containing protein